jgi:hypothetical protein
MNWKAGLAGLLLAGCVSYQPSVLDEFAARVQYHQRIPRRTIIGRVLDYAMMVQPTRDGFEREHVTLASTAYGPQLFSCKETFTTDVIPEGRTWHRPAEPRRGSEFSLDEPRIAYIFNGIPVYHSCGARLRGSVGSADPAARASAGAPQHR